MSLTTDQKATAAYKKDKGVADTNTNKRFFEEPVGGRVSLASKTWAEDSLIPTTAPTLEDGETSGVVKKFVDLVLTSVPGSPDSFYHDELKNAVPFNWGDGSYAYVVRNSNDVILPAGYNDVEVDNGAGILRFYGGAPLNMPPKITFYKYVGKFGAGATGFFSFNTGALAAGVIKSVEHNASLSSYIIIARDPDNNNNVQTNLLRPDPLNPTNNIEIEVGIDFPEPGLIIQIVGI